MPPSTPSVIPDYAQYLTGSRVWRLPTSRSFETRGQLRSLTMDGVVWVPKQIHTAVCSRVKEDYERDHCPACGAHMHVPPASGCRCGVWAIKDASRLAPLTDQIWDYGQRTVYIYGTVALWGKVIEHAYGYRAQYAYPLSFWAPEAHHAWLEPWGVPVEGVPKAWLRDEEEETKDEEEEDTFPQWTQWTGFGTPRAPMSTKHFYGYASLAAPPFEPRYGPSPVYDPHESLVVEPSMDQIVKYGQLRPEQGRDVLLDNLPLSTLVDRFFKGAPLVAKLRGAVSSGHNA